MMQTSQISGKTTAREDGTTMSYSNPFVSYLNSLQSIDADNRGALAEAQARNPLFSELRVDPPLANEIFDELTRESGGHVILTGHAGDGKSTLALSVIRSLLGLSKDLPLQGGLMKIHPISYNGRQYIVIKDLSECTYKERSEIVDNWFKSGTKDRYLLVSNTGALLSLFRESKNRTGEDIATIEDRLLKTIVPDDYEKCKQFNFGNITFKVHNLALYDNLDLGIKLFVRMVRSNKWTQCCNCPASSGCPLFKNRNIVNENLNLITSRIRLLYFRAYAYGERLTMRQISAHFSFILTGGRSCKEMIKRVSSGAEIHFEHHLFSNLFWGDDGENEIPQATRQLRAIQLFCELELNTKYTPSQERLFWDCIHRSTNNSPLFTELWDRTKSVILKSHSISRNAAMVRRNWRRVVYFLTEGPSATDNERKIFDGFLSTFIGSYFAINLLKWKESPETFQPSKLKPALFVALQRQFSGIVVPNGPIHDWTLFLTLGKLSKDINQNAQLVLCKVPFNEKLAIELSEGKLFLVGKKELKNCVHMELPLSFIDYVFAIRSGELGRGLQLSYRDRIENLKSIIHKKLGSSDADELLIMQRSNDGRVSTISVSVSNNKMVVSND